MEIKPVGDSGELPPLEPPSFVPNSEPEWPLPPVFSDSSAGGASGENGAEPLPESILSAMPATTAELLKRFRGAIDFDLLLDCSRPEAELRRLFRRYLFVLVLEEVHCPDYRSGFVYWALEEHSVPILSNHAAYLKHLPDRAAIDLAQFASLSELQQYVRLVSNDVRSYSKFFGWKRHFQVSYRRNDVCELCELLQRPPAASAAPAQPGGQAQPDRPAPAAASVGPAYAAGPAASAVPAAAEPAATTASTSPPADPTAALARAEQAAPAASDAAAAPAGPAADAAAAASTAEQPATAGGALPEKPVAVDPHLALFGAPARGRSAGSAAPRKPPATGRILLTSWLQQANCSRINFEHLLK